MSALDEVTRKVIQGLLGAEQGGEPPVLRVFMPNPETGTHQIIFQDRLTAWAARVEDESEWSVDVETAEYRFLCSPENVAEVKVRLKPAHQIWLRTPDNRWVAQIFRWSELHPNQAYQTFIADAWRESNPPKEPPAIH